MRGLTQGGDRVIDVDDFQLPQFWAAFRGIEPPARALLTETDHAAKDGHRLSHFVAAVGELGMHGAIAAVALTWCALEDLAGTLGVRTATTVALVSRVVPWRDRRVSPPTRSSRRGEWVGTLRRCGGRRGS